MGGLVTKYIEKGPFQRNIYRMLYQARESDQYDPWRDGMRGVSAAKFGKTGISLRDENGDTSITGYILIAIIVVVGLFLLPMFLWVCREDCKRCIEWLKSDQADDRWQSGY